MGPMGKIRDKRRNTIPEVGEDNKRTKSQLVLPDSKKNEVLALQHCHDAPTAAHLDVEKKWKKSKKIFTGQA